MTAPTPTEIRAFLEGYGISTSILSDPWLTARMANFVVPYINGVIGFDFTDSEGVEITEYLSGTGKDILILSYKEIDSVVSIEYVTGGDEDLSIGVSSVRVLSGGILKAVDSMTEGRISLFMKGQRNIKIVYKLKTAPLNEAALYLAAEQALGFVGARTGGGSISVEGYSRNFGERGKYQDIRNDLKRQAMFLLSSYSTGVVGR